MKIEINHCNNKKKFIDEITYISTKYDKLKIYPHQKIGLYTNNLLKIIITYILVPIFLLLLNHVYTDDFIKIATYSLTGFCIFINIYVIKIYVKIKSKIKKELNEKVDSIITIDEKKIILKNNNSKITAELEWENIKYILYSKYSITFIPVDNKYVLIGIPIEYKDELLKAINKYNIEKTIYDKSNN